MRRRSWGWVGITAIALVLSMMVGGQLSSQNQRQSASAEILAQQPAETSPAAGSSVPALSGTYEDPQGNFQVGILEGATTSTFAGHPLFQLPGGDLAYSIVRVPLNGEAALSDIALVELARQALDNGEGFQTQSFSPVPGGGLQIGWTGRLSQGAAPPQPISGTILAKQQGAEAYFLVVAALEAATEQVPQVLVTLSDTLKIL